MILNRAPVVSIQNSCRTDFPVCPSDFIWGQARMPVLLGRLGVSTNLNLRHYNLVVTGKPC